MTLFDRDTVDCLKRSSLSALACGPVRHRFRQLTSGAVLLALGSHPGTYGALTVSKLVGWVLLGKLGCHLIFLVPQLTQLGDVFHQCWQYLECSANSAYSLTKDQCHGLELWMREARVSVYSVAAQLYFSGIIAYRDHSQRQNPSLSLWT